MLIDSGEGVFTSVGLFETPDQAHASTRLAEAWIRDEDLVSALPRPPRTTMGLVIAKALKGETLTMGTPIHR